MNQKTVDNSPRFWGALGGGLSAKLQAVYEGKRIGVSFMLSKERERNDIVGLDPV